MAFICLSRAIVSGPSSVAKASINIGADTVTGAVKRDVVARALGPVDVWIDTAASLVNADLFNV